MELSPRPRLVAGVLAALVLTGLVIASLWTVQPPSPAPADAPTDQFSAGRAFTHVEKVGASVHVAGSPGAAEVRRYIVSRLEELGLEVRVQESVGETDALVGSAMAHVQNVVAVLPGTASTGRVFLVAHYDSAQVSYGANDDGAGVGTLLETARAMAAGPAPRNDVVFLFTDAEEACLCGAEAFVSRDELARAGGVVLNVEARGSGGPVIMFETTTGNAGVVGVYAEHAEHPVATSFAVEVYRILPNDTDFTPFRESGRFTGLNSAYIDGVMAYHSPDDTPESMNQGSLQQHGDNALALARAFSATDLSTMTEPSSGDLTYFPVFGLLVRYPAVLVWPFAGLAVIAVGALAVLVHRRRLATVGQLAGGFGATLLPILLAPVAAQALWAGLGAVRPDYRDLLDPWQPGWYRLAVVALTLTILCGWFGLLRRRVGGWALAVGGLGWLALLGLLLAAATPGGSYLTALPALAVAVGGIVAVTGPGRPILGVVALTLGAAVAVVVLAPTVLLFFPALGLATAGVGALVAMLLGLALLPVLDQLYPAPPTRHRLWTSTPAIVAGVLTVAAVATGLAVDRFDAAHPTRTHLMYALDADTRSARWVSGESDPGEWTRQFVSARADLSKTFPLFDEEVWTGTAQAADLPTPTLTVVSDTTSGGERTLELLVEPQRQVILTWLQVEGATVTAARADGRDVTMGEPTGEPFQLLFFAPPPGGLSVRLTLSAGGPVSIRVGDGSVGLTRLPGFQPRPPEVGIVGSHTSELVLVTKTHRV